MLPGGKYSGTMISEKGPSASRLCGTTIVGISVIFPGSPLSAVPSFTVSYEEISIVYPVIYFTLVERSLIGSTARGKIVSRATNVVIVSLNCIHDLLTPC